MTKKAITKTTLAVSLDIDVAERIKQVARQEERSVSQMVQRALVHYLPTVQCETCHQEPPSVERSYNHLLATVPPDQL
jgi:hypothetical protein